MRGTSFDHSPQFSVLKIFLNIISEFIFLPHVHHLFQDKPSAMATAVQAATATSPTSAEAAAEQQQQMYLQQQYAAQGITHGYPGMMDDGPVDPMQAQVAAFNNQAAMYGPYGAPYALNFPHQQPHAYYAVRLLLYTTRSFRNCQALTSCMVTGLCAVHGPGVVATRRKKWCLRPALRAIGAQCRSLS